MVFKYVFWAICLNINIQEIQTAVASYERIKEKKWATNYIEEEEKSLLNTYVWTDMYFLNYIYIPSWV